jgi:NAD(P)-dependent dehydrogenase (short-subunit alcohol dehydrogenase family)
VFTGLTVTIEEVNGRIVQTWHLEDYFGLATQLGLRFPCSALRTDKHMALDERTAVVTGAARGIGHAYCQRLAADGASVVAVDIDDPTDSLKDLSGDGEKLGLVCDGSQPEQISAAAAAVIERFGRCDILVNNAGIFPATSLDSVTAELWHRVQAVNVEAVLLFAQAFAPGMRAAGRGRIVNTGSANTVPDPARRPLTAEFPAAARAVTAPPA